MPVMFCLETDPPAEAGERDRVLAAGKRKQDVPLLRCYSGALEDRSETAVQKIRQMENCRHEVTVGEPLVGHASQDIDYLQRSQIKE